VRALPAALAIAAIALGLYRPAAGDPETSRALYQAAKRKYERGDWARAIELFEEAYREHPSPAYLYNIAQAQRRKGDCPAAVAHYRKFLATNPAQAVKDQVEGYVAELEGECGGQIAPHPSSPPASGGREPETDSASGPRVASGGREPETDSTDPASGPRVASADPDPDLAGTIERRPASVEGRAAAPGPRLFVASAEAGVALFSLGDVEVPVSPSLRLFAGYPIHVAGFDIEPGVAIERATMEYEHTGSSSTALFATALAGVQVRRAFDARFAAAADLGAGMLRVSSLEEGNPFVEAGAARDGAANSLALRAGASGELALGRGLAAVLSPAFIWAARTDDLREPISSMSRWELLAGVRYRR
jgi:hypothetical protein